jgi:hypothetical protein
MEVEILTFSFHRQQCNSGRTAAILLSLYLIAAGELIVDYDHGKML